MPTAPKVRIITLLTDFGLSDPFVGIMKGVILARAPRARLIDLTHEVEPFQIAQARFLLGESWRFFPAGTIHLAVVDPGVGSERRPILVEAAKHLFLGPDNGLFSDLLTLPKVKVRHVTNAKLFLPEISATFHGRDIFAPVAAHLAAGLPPSKVGPVIHDPHRIVTGVPNRTGRRFWSGEIAHIDHFGNLITNLPIAGFPTLSRRPFALKVGFAEISGLSPSYAAGQPGELMVLVGSSGNLEVAVNQDSAARLLGVAVGSPVELEMP